MDNATNAEHADYADTAARENADLAPDLNALLASDTRMQSQFDRLVSKALGTARGNWEREMNAREAETRQALEAQRGEELAQREAELARRESRAEAAALLSARGLPPELADFVDDGDADAMEKSVGRLESAFRSAVEGELKKRLKGEPPRTGASAPNDMRVRKAMGLKSEAG